MKKLLMGMMAVFAGLVSSPAHAIRHSLTNGSDKTIDVFMYLHGESMLGTNAEKCLKNPFTSCCRREKRGLKPGEWVEWDTKACQLKRVRVVISGTDQEFAANVRNASLNEAKKVGVVVAGVLVTAAVTAATAGVGLTVVAPAAAAAGAVNATAAAAGAITAASGAVGAAGAGTGAIIVGKKLWNNTENELVAYGSTGWLYDGSSIEPVNGVTIYRK